MKEKLKSIFFEMIPVVLGILIALWAENIRAEFDNQEKLDEIIKLVGREATENITALNASIKLNQAVSDSLTQYLSNSEISLDVIIIRAGGLKIPIIKSYTPSLLYGLNSEDKIANWNLISLISENQETIEILKNRVSDLTKLDIVSTNKAEKQKLNFILGDIDFAGKALLNNFNKVDSLVKTIKK